MKYVYLSILILSFVTTVLADEQIQVAEYRADVDDIVWRVGTEKSDAGFGDGVTEHQQHSFGGTELYDPETGLSAGPSVSFTPNSITQLFVSLSQEQTRDDINPGRWGGDSFTQRAGLRQTWYLARRRAQITLDYGIEQGDTEDLYDDRRSHGILFSSRFPLFWGLSARIQANYAQSSYLDYLGVNEVNSEKQLFQASINRPFTERLYGEFQFSYLNEEFDDAELSYRRYSWGLNLRYKY